MPADRKKKKDDIALHVFIPRDWHDWLRDKAHADRISIAELVRLSLETTYSELPSRPDPEEDRKGGEVALVPNLRTSTSLCDRSG